MCPLEVISLGADGVDVEMLGIGVFEGHKLSDLLSFREWS
jgi:hypothetical protein